MILFGVRSPLVVDFEETLARCGVPVTAAVSVSGAPRLLDRSRLVDLQNFRPDAAESFVACAFSRERRAELVRLAVSLGLAKARALIDPTAIVPRALRAGPCTFVNAGVVIGAVSMLGEGVLVNRRASLGHHCVLGDYVSIGPGATLAGNIHVGEAAVIGAGAVVLPDVRIGARAIVAAGSVVRTHVPEGALVAGNPAVVKRAVAGRTSMNVDDGE
jgi:sugar O-acyltransferase (sialic acid O-acetyltransferase NeuD family)